MIESKKQGLVNFVGSFSAEEQEEWRALPALLQGAQTAAANKYKHRAPVAHTACPAQAELTSEPEGRATHTQSYCSKRAQSAVTKLESGTQHTR